MGRLGQRREGRDGRSVRHHYSRIVQPPLAGIQDLLDADDQIRISDPGQRRPEKFEAGQPISLIKNEPGLEYLVDKLNGVGNPVFFDRTGVTENCFNASCRAYPDIVDQSVYADIAPRIGLDLFVILNHDLPAAYTRFLAAMAGHLRSLPTNLMAGIDQATRDMSLLGVMDCFCLLETGVSIEDIDAAFDDISPLVHGGDSRLLDGIKRIVSEEMKRLGSASSD